MVALTRDMWAVVSATMLMLTFYGRSEGWVVASASRR
jgi:hypothetical protein